MKLSGVSNLCGRLSAMSDTGIFARTCWSCRLQLRPRQCVLSPASRTGGPAVQTNLSDAECEHLTARIQAMIDENALPEGEMPTCKQFQQPGSSRLAASHFISRRIAEASASHQLAAFQGVPAVRIGFWEGCTVKPVPTPVSQHVLPKHVSDILHHPMR